MSETTHELIEAGLQDHLASLSRRRAAVAAVREGGPQAILAARRRQHLEVLEGREAQRLAAAPQQHARNRAWRNPDESDREPRRAVSLEGAVRHLESLHAAEAERREREAELTKHERDPYRTEATLRDHRASLARRHAARVALGQERRDAALAELHQARSAEARAHE